MFLSHMFNLYCVYIAIGIAHITNAAPRFTDRIIGGKNVELVQFPYQASLRYFNYHYCGGAIISMKFVVTAAHCLYRMSPNKITVNVGSSNRLTGGISHEMYDMYIHEQYEPETENYDIGIIQIYSWILFTTTISPIAVSCLNAIPQGSLGIVSGWGITEEGGRSLSIWLQSAEVPILAQEECFAKLSIYNFSNAMLCAGYLRGMRDACQGDSGGPLILQNELIGIVSWGVGCGRPNLPGIYTNISAVRGFIHRIARTWSRC